MDRFERNPRAGNGYGCNAMAVTITVQNLAARLRITDGTAPPPEPVNSELTDYLAAATARIQTFAPTAPDAVHNLAAVVYVAYLYESPGAASGDGFANAWRNSGARSLLTPYRTLRAVAL